MVQSLGAATVTGTARDAPGRTDEGGLVSEQWWFNLRTQTVEQGPGDPNSERLGPYATREEADGVLARMKDRNEAFDAGEDD
jgi:hypothetical protein